MMMGMGLLALALLAQDVPKFPPHYGAQAMTCPVGGEAFQGPALMHYSTFGSKPDGEPNGSIAFPILRPECPGNGLIIYDRFSPEAVTKLTPFVASDAYKAMRGRETSYYRAYWLAKQIGDPQAPWLLLSAWWEAKNKADAALVQRYGTLFVEAVAALPVDATSAESVALRARAANALRELGRYDEAERVRAAIVIDPAMGGADDNGKRKREGWSRFVAKLAAPIARHDPSRQPIDLMVPRQAAWRCIATETANPETPPPAPLTPFETQYCAAPEMAAEIVKVRKANADSQAMLAKIRANQKP
jgi:hypothetical protein